MEKTRWSFAVTCGDSTSLSVVLAWYKADAEKFLKEHFNADSICYIGESYGAYDFIL